MITRTLLFTAVFAALLAAQNKKDLCKLAGRLTNAITNEPVRKAKVSLHPGDPSKTVYSLVSDAEGKFQFENIEPGRYTLQGEKAGFVEGWYGEGHEPATIELRAGKDTSELVVKLTPQGVIAGRVLDDEGEPVGGLMVMPLRNMYINGHKQLMPVMTGMPIQTNDLGEYRLSNLPPGKYFVHSDANKLTDMAMGMAKSQDAADARPQDLLIASYYPSAPDAASATVVEVGPGAEVRAIDIRLKRVRAQKVSGKVMDVSGQPVKSGMLMLYRQDPGAMQIMPSGMIMLQGDKGEFETPGLAPGTYNVMAMSMADPTHMAAVGRIEVADQPVHDLTLHLGQGGDLPVHVAMKEGDPHGIRIMLQVDNNPLASLTNAEIAKDGTGVLNKVSPGLYKLQVLGIPQDHYLQSARLGSRDVLESGVDFRNGVAGTLELTIAAPPAKLSGSVKNDKDEFVPGATVTVIPKDSKWRTDMAHTVTTDQNGRFEFTGLVPAEYRVYAWQEIESGAAEDEEFRRPFEKFRAEVDLRQVGQAPAPLQLELIQIEVR